MQQRSDWWIGSVALLACVLVAVWGMGPQTRLDAPLSGPGGDESGPAAADLDGSARGASALDQAAGPDPAQTASGAAPERTQVEAGDGFVVRGRLLFPPGASMPDDIRVYAVRSEVGGGSRIDPEDVRRTLEADAPRADVIDADGRFSILLPGPAPLEEKWGLVAGGTGWVRTIWFPDPRPKAPPPTAEVEIDMQPVFAVTVEVTMPDGSAPRLSRSLARRAGGSGLHMYRGWGMVGPAMADSTTVRMGVPQGLPPVVGGLDPSIGFGGKELAVRQGVWEDWERGRLDLQYHLNPPGYETVEAKVVLLPIARGEIPHQGFTLKPESALGEVALRFDRCAWWAEELAPHDLAAVQIELKWLEDHTESKSGANTWKIELDQPLASGELVLSGLPAGGYEVSVRAPASGITLPTSPTSLLIRAEERSELRIDGGELGVLELLRDEASAGEWSEGRLVFMHVQGQELRRFHRRDWPVRLGPLPPGEAVLLVRSLDRKTPPQVADRLNHDDIYLVVPATTTRYTVVGVN